MGDKLTPDEMAELGIHRVTPAEAHGRDNGAGPRAPAPDVGEGPVHDLTNSERLLLGPNDKLFPGVNDPGGRPEHWTNNPSESGDLITQGLQIGAFGRIAGAPFQAIAPEAESAGAARMASSAALHGARTAGAAGAGGGVDILPVLARLLMGHSALAKTAHMAAKIIPAAGESVAAGAPALMEGAAAGAQSIAPVRAAMAPQDTPEQRMARILMQGIAQPEMK